MIHHPLANITEWRKGCSCATTSPAECEACTVGLIEAIEKWFLGNEPWQSIGEIDATNRYAHQYLLFSPELIDPDFNPSGTVLGHWCDDLGWQAPVWCGYCDQFHTKVVNPTHFMATPTSPVIPRATE